MSFADLCDTIAVLNVKRFRKVSRAVARKVFNIFYRFNFLCENIALLNKINFDVSKSLDMHLSLLKYMFMPNEIS